MPHLSASRLPARSSEPGRPCKTRLVNGVSLNLRAEPSHGLFGLGLEQCPELSALLAVCCVLQVSVVILDVLELVVKDGDQTVILVSTRHPASLLQPAHR